MKTESYRELKVLEELSNDSAPTQRSISQKLGVALGLTNLMIRRSVKKGYVKVVNMEGNRVRYLLTPKGVTEKTRLTYEYLEYSIHLYREVRRAIQGALGPVIRSGGKRVLLFGTGEIAEIAYLTIKEAGLHPIGAVDEESAKESFLGLPVIRFRDLSGISFDCGILASLEGGVESMQERFRAAGIPPEKALVTLERRGLEILAHTGSGNGRHGGKEKHGSE